MKLKIIYKASFVAIKSCAQTQCMQHKTVQFYAFIMSYYVHTIYVLKSPADLISRISDQRSTDGEGFC